MAISAGLDSRSVGWITGGAAAMRDGELSCGFKLALSVMSCPGSESALTPVKPRFTTLARQRARATNVARRPRFRPPLARLSATADLQRIRTAYGATAR